MLPVLPRVPGLIRAPRFRLERDGTARFFFFFFFRKIKLDRQST
jgi:hypothetical protein